MTLFNSYLTNLSFFTCPMRLECMSIGSIQQAVKMIETFECVDLECRCYNSQLLPLGSDGIECNDHQTRTSSRKLSNLRYPNVTYSVSTQQRRYDMYICKYSIELIVHAEVRTLNMREKLRFKTPLIYNLNVALLTVAARRRILGVVKLKAKKLILQGVMQVIGVDISVYI